MKEDLFPYYEAELRFIREMAKEFAESHRDAAKRLFIDGGTSTDPHIERMIHAFALLAGRIRHKLDDEFPEITEALLGILYPHYIRPIPSMGIAQFQLDATQGKVSGPRKLKAGLPVISKAVDQTGEPCRFRTAYPVTLWPLRVDSARVLLPRMLPGPVPEEVVYAIQLTIACEGESQLGELGIDHLRFYLSGEGQIPFILYELLLNSVHSVQFSRINDDVTIGPMTLPDGCLQAVGFEREEGLLEYPDRSFIGYRLLTEYLAFPQKFLFIDLLGLDKLPLDQCGKQFEITFLLRDFESKDRIRRLERVMRADNFQLGCTPIVNLFQRPADPIAVSHTQTEYRVIPNQNSPLSHEVYSVDKVTSVASYEEEAREYQPFYGFRYSYGTKEPEQFWYSSRRSLRKTDKDGNVDHGTEVYLSLVDKEFRPTRGGTETLSVAVTCTNRDRPVDLQISQIFGELIVDGAGLKTRCLVGPTESIRPELRSGLQWRLISHLSLNHLSLVRTDAQALREILSLYNFSNDPEKRDLISSIAGVSVQPDITRMETVAGVTFVPGLRVRIELNEERIHRGDTFLFATVLERFLGLYCAANSFTRVEVRTQQRKGALRIWPARAGERILA
jgi:type VI secretion system protein ImpG